MEALTYLIPILVIFIYSLFFNFKSAPKLEVTPSQSGFDLHIKEVILQMLNIPPSIDMPIISFDSMQCLMDFETMKFNLDLTKKFISFSSITLENLILKIEGCPIQGLQNFSTKFEIGQLKIFDKELKYLTCDLKKLAQGQMEIHVDRNEGTFKEVLEFLPEDTDCYLDVLDTIKFKKFHLDLVICITEFTLEINAECHNWQILDDPKLVIEEPKCKLRYESNNKTSKKLIIVGMLVLGDIKLNQLEIDLLNNNEWNFNIWPSNLNLKKLIWSLSSVSIDIFDMNVLIEKFNFQLLPKQKLKFPKLKAFNMEIKLSNFVFLESPMKLFCESSTFVIKYTPTNDKGLQKLDGSKISGIFMINTLNLGTVDIFLENDQFRIAYKKSFNLSFSDTMKFLKDPIQEAGNTMCPTKDEINFGALNLQVSWPFNDKKAKQFEIEFNYDDNKGLNIFDILSITKFQCFFKYFAENGKSWGLNGTAIIESVDVDFYYQGSIIILKKGSKIPSKFINKFKENEFDPSSKHDNFNLDLFKLNCKTKEIIFEGIISDINIYIIGSVSPIEVAVGAKNVIPTFLEKICENLSFTTSNDGLLISTTENMELIKWAENKIQKTSKLKEKTKKFLEYECEFLFEGEFKEFFDLTGGFQGFFGYNLEKKDYVLDCVIHRSALNSICKEAKLSLRYNNGIKVNVEFPVSISKNLEFNLNGVIEFKPNSMALKMENNIQWKNALRVSNLNFDLKFAAQLTNEIKQKLTLEVQGKISAKYKETIIFGEVHVDVSKLSPSLIVVHIENISFGDILGWILNTKSPILNYLPVIEQVLYIINASTFEKSIKIQNLDNYLTGLKDEALLKKDNDGKLIVGPSTKIICFAIKLFKIWEIKFEGFCNIGIDDINVKSLFSSDKINIKLLKEGKCLYCRALFNKCTFGNGFFEIGGTKKIFPEQSETGRGELYFGDQGLKISLEAGVTVFWNMHAAVILSLDNKSLIGKFGLELFWFQFNLELVMKESILEFNGGFIQEESVMNKYFDKISKSVYKDINRTIQEIKEAASKGSFWNVQLSSGENEILIEMKFKIFSTLEVNFNFKIHLSKDLINEIVNRLIEKIKELIAQKIEDTLRNLETLDERERKEFIEIFFGNSEERKEFLENLEKTHNLDMRQELEMQLEIYIEYIEFYRDGKCGKTMDCGKHLCGKEKNHDGLCVGHKDKGEVYDRMVRCNCRKKIQKSKGRCDEKFSCNQVCGKTLNCKKHTCEEICHEKCSPCKEKCAKDACYKKHKCEQLCHEDACKCIELCAEVLACGVHKCQSLCSDCSGDHNLCTEICQRLLECGRHKCNKACHGNTYCNPCNDPNCQHNVKCNALLACNKHSCQKLSHPPPCKRCSLCCLKPLPCNYGKICTEPVHPDSCQSCPNLEILCQCGKKLFKIPKCKHTSAKFSCQERCNAQLPCDCKCDKICHSPSISCTCEKICQKILKCNKHQCNAPHHKGDCRSCEIKVKCRCKKTEKYCPASNFICDIKCNKQLDCKHICKCGKTCDLHQNDFKCQEPVAKPVICGSRNHSESILVICTSPTPECSKKCNKILTCLHQCNQECNKHNSGQCPPCNKKVPVRQDCYCHQFPVTVNVECLKSSMKLPLRSCDKRCPFIHKSCGHQCIKKCHDGPCGECKNSIFKTIICYCGKKREIPVLCSSQNEPFDPCYQLCSKSLNCGHFCQKGCHKMNCPPCLKLVEKQCCKFHQIKLVSCSVKKVECPIGIEMQIENYDFDINIGQSLLTLGATSSNKATVSKSIVNRTKEMDLQDAAQEYLLLENCEKYNKLWEIWHPYINYLYHYIKSKILSQTTCINYKSIKGRLVIELSEKRSNNLQVNLLFTILLVLRLFNCEVEIIFAGDRTYYEPFLFKSFGTPLILEKLLSLLQASCQHFDPSILSQSVPLLEKELDFIFVIGYHKQLSIEQLTEKFKSVLKNNQYGFCILTNPESLQFQFQQKSCNTLEELLSSLLCPRPLQNDSSKPKLHCCLNQQGLKFVEYLSKNFEILKVMWEKHLKIPDHKVDKLIFSNYSQCNFLSNLPAPEIPKKMSGKPLIKFNVTESGILWDNLQIALKITSDSAKAAFHSVPPNLFTKYSTSSRGKNIDMKGIMKLEATNYTSTEIYSLKNRGGKRQISVAIIVDLSSSGLELLWDNIIPAALILAECFEKSKISTTFLTLGDEIRLIKDSNIFNWDNESKYRFFHAVYLAQFKNDTNADVLGAILHAIDHLKADSKIGTGDPRQIILLTGVYTGTEKLSHSINAIMNAYKFGFSVVSFSTLRNALARSGLSKAFVLSSFIKLDSIIADIFKSSNEDISEVHFKGEAPKINWKYPLAQYILEGSPKAHEFETKNNDVNGGVHNKYLTTCFDYWISDGGSASRLNFAFIKLYVSILAKCWGKHHTVYLENKTPQNEQQLIKDEKDIAKLCLETFKMSEVGQKRNIQIILDINKYCVKWLARDLNHRYCVRIRENALQKNFTGSGKTLQKIEFSFSFMKLL